MDQQLVQLSRTMAFALRHHPEDFDLTLDPEGWVTVNDLLTALRKHRTIWQNLRADDIAQVIAQSEKTRFEMRDDKIRAYYGHSVETKIAKTATTPPTILYHGTTSHAASSIKKEGLKSMKRQYVHLSAEKETAVQVALRRTRRPVILQIHALKAHQQGIKFYLGNDTIWLAESIPPQFIQVGSEH